MIVLSGGAVAFSKVVDPTVAGLEVPVLVFDRGLGKEGGSR